MTALLEVDDLSKAFVGVRALDGVSFKVEAGRITGLIGPNGSGKSTAIDCVSGFQPIDVKAVAQTGVTVLVVEQNVHSALLISDQALVMEQGRKFMLGPASEVRADPRIRQAYLGGNIQPTAA